jgi:hypothetical protein
MDAKMLVRASSEGNRSVRWLLPAMLLQAMLVGPEGFEPPTKGL